jgi:sugar phosphate permease
MDNRSSSPAPVGADPSAVGKTYPSTRLSLAIWGIAALFYLTVFYQLVAPAMMRVELMHDFGVDAGGFGTILMWYLTIYVLLQIPVGVFIDCWGARKVLITGALLSAAGSFIFGAAPTFGVACFGRALIGAANATGWLVLMKLLGAWFPSKRFAMFTGLGLLWGNLGSVAGQAPLRMAIETFGWRPVALASGAVILAIAILAWAFLRDDPSELGHLSYGPNLADQPKQSALAGLRAGWEGFKGVFRYKNTWLIFFAQGGIVGPILTFTGAWGAPYLAVRYGLTTRNGALVCSVMTMCWAAASPLFGQMSQKIGRRKPLYIGGVVVACAGWCTIYYTKVSLAGFIGIAAIASLATSCVIIGYALGKESVSPRVLGTVAGAVTMGNMIGPNILQPAVGRVLEMQWTGRVANGVHVYGLPEFQTAFLLVIGWSMLAIILLSLTTETHNKPMVRD